LDKVLEKVHLLTEARLPEKRKGNQHKESQSLLHHLHQKVQGQQ